MTHITRRASIAVIALLTALLAGCAQPGAAPDSPERRAELAGRLADLSVELGSLDKKLDTGAEQAWEASADTLTLELGRELTEEEQSQVRGILRDTLAEFLTVALWKEQIGKAYADHFTAGELEAIVEFFSAPAGRKVLELDQTLSEAVESGLDAALGGHIDEFIERVDERLAASFDGLEGGEGS
jgi:Uncharacterized protein conserved in bacteria (DUF2059)